VPHLVTAVIKPFKLDEVKAALQAEGIVGMTVSEVQGFGRQGGKTETFRGAEYTVDYVPKVRLDVVVGDALVDRAIEVIAEVAKTGKIGDGKIWAVGLARVARIRTGEVGDEAI